MRARCAIYNLLFTVLVPVCMLGEPALVPTNVNVGRHLQTPAKVTLEEQASFAGLQVTITVDDAARGLLAKRSDAAGASSIVVDVNPGAKETPEFWIQGLADTGNVTYTATAPGFRPGKGTITLAPSGIVILGPFRAPKFPTTPRAEPSRLLVQSARLDADLKFAEQQPIAGGKTAKFEIENPQSSIGVVANPHLAIQGGTAGAVTEFRPLKMGETKLSIKQPPDFKTAADLGAVTAMVIMPGLAITDQVTIGQNLQIGGLLGLGQAAPAEGVVVTLTSEDPEKLLIARTANDQGSKSLKIVVKADGTTDKFYLQALSGSGSATYTASAPGYRSRTATIALAPSGVVITPRPYGPPDEAELFRKRGEAEADRGFISRLSRSDTMALVVWTVQLDPETHRSADVTVQELRAGMQLRVPLKTSNPAVGKVDPTVTIKGGSDNAVTHFKPVNAGTTLVSVITPQEFTQSANSTSVTAVVKE
jgi:hypothetical protein